MINESFIDIFLKSPKYSRSLKLDETNDEFQMTLNLGYSSDFQL